VESKKRGEGGREKKTGGGTEKTSRRGKMSKEGNGEADKSRRKMAETKRSRRRLPSESRSIGNGRTDVEKKLVEEDESRTIGISSSDRGDESD